MPEIGDKVRAVCNGHKFVKGDVGIVDNKWMGVSELYLGIKLNNKHIGPSLSTCWEVFPKEPITRRKFK